IKMNDFTKDFTFRADEYTGKNNYVVFNDTQVKPEKMNKIEFSQETKGISFASASWHYSTQKMPKEEKGDLLSVSRKYYLREVKNNKMTLKPLKEGQKIKVGDQVEVHLSIRAKHAAEYVHLKDPRAA